MGLVFAERTERNPKTQLKPVFHCHCTKIVQNKLFRWVGMVCFLSPQENGFCWARNHLLLYLTQKCSVDMLRQLFGRWIFLVSLGNPLFCPNVQCKKKTLLFRVIPVRASKPRHVSLSTCWECSLQHRPVPCPLRRNYFDQGGGRNAAVRVV